MKIFIATTLTLFLFSNIPTAFSQRIGIENPSAAYVDFLGYKYESRKDSKGAEYGVCIFPDSSECQAWYFFRGICGEKYSYCALKGCGTKTKIDDKGSYTAQYAVCSCIDSKGATQDIPLIDFMEQHGDTLFKFKKGK
ncbi:MAG: DUF333 domain-containing protein [Bacteroidota bacterium]